MNSTQQNNLEKGIEALRLVGFEDNVAKFDPKVVEDMKARGLHVFHVLETKNGFGEVVFVDYLYMSEEDDLTVDGFTTFMKWLSKGQVYSNCVSDFNYGEGELGLIGIGKKNGKLVRTF